MLCQTLGTVLGCWLCCGGVGSPIFFLVSGLLLGKEVERCDLAFSGVFAMRCAEKSPVADVKSLGEVQVALGAFHTPGLLTWTHIPQCLLEQWYRFLQLLCTLPRLFSSLRFDCDGRLILAHRCTPVYKDL